MADLTKPPLGPEGPTPETINHLGALDTLEVTLTARGANGRPFAVRKSATVEKTTMSTPTKKTDQLPTPPPPTEPANPADAPAPEAKAAPAPPAPPAPTEQKPADAMACKGCKKAMDPAFKFCPDCGAGVEVEVKPAGDQPMPEQAAPTKADPGPSDVHVPTTEQKPPEPPPVAKSDEVAKAMATMPASVRKAYSEAIAKAAALEAEIKKSKQIEARKSYVAKAASVFKHVAGKPEDLGALLHDLHDTNPTLATRVEAVLAGSEAALAKSSLFVEVGKSAAETTSATTGSAWERIEAAAKGISESEKIPMSKAISKALATKEGAELYRQYEIEQKAAP